MKGFKTLTTVLSLVIMMAACAPAIEKDAAAITAAEDALFDENQGITDKSKAMELVDLYVAFADNYPEDSMAAEYLFKGAEFCLSLGEGQRSIDLYDRVMLEYPDFRKAPECLFLKGYVFENYLGDLEEAKIIYELFLQKYPENDFADDARISIQNLGKSPEELIKQFEEQQQANPE